MKAVPGALREVDRYPARQRHVAGFAEQALDREMDGDQRGRAGALHGEGRSPEVQLVGDPGRKRVAGVGHQELQWIPGALARQEMEQEIGAGRRPGEETDRPVMADWVVAGVLQRLPGALQKHPVLGVEDLRLPVVDAEKRGVESAGVGDLGDRRHMVRIVEEGGVEPAVHQLRRGE